jgi:hypothetical protein
MPSTGRPPVEVNLNDLYELAKLLCTDEEIAAFFGVDSDTIKSRFSSLIKQGRENGKASLRRLQWKSAQDGNIQMQIHLGRTLLKQRDWDANDPNTTVIVRGGLPAQG